MLSDGGPFLQGSPNHVVDILTLLLSYKSIRCGLSKPVPGFSKEVTVIVVNFLTNSGEQDSAKGDHILAFGVETAFEHVKRSEQSFLL
jgi:hypothetical protein